MEETLEDFPTPPDFDDDDDGDDGQHVYISLHIQDQECHAVGANVMLPSESTDDEIADHLLRVLLAVATARGDSTLTAVQHKLMRWGQLDV